MSASLPSKPGPSPGPPSAGPAARPASPPRPHTGRQRNEEVRKAILAAALGLAAGRGSAGFTMEELAGAAGVSKRTIYRWWNNRSAILMEALLDRASTSVVQRDSGDYEADLLTFVRTTYEAVSTPQVAGALKLIMAEGLNGGAAEEALREFVGRRRAALLAVLAADPQGDAGPSRYDPELIADTVFGILWYRLLIGHDQLTGDVPEVVVDLVLGRPRGSRSGNRGPS